MLGRPSLLTNIPLFFFPTTRCQIPIQKNPFASTMYRNTLVKHHHSQLESEKKLCLFSKGEMGASI